MTNKTIILLILSITVILRFFNYFEIPFSHDEFSALFRLHFDNFSELIDKGVKIDGHPAGIQVFLYYWTKLFGQQEWIVKLPFTIFGVLSVYLVYLIGKKWFNETVGLISAAYLASIQFTIMYSQIARPYISGMFFSLLMIYYWSNLMMNPHRNFNKNAILFIIATSLCTYNHHFSLLFASIVGISGVLFIQRKYLIKYLLAGLLVLILYIPHLRVFIYQLNVGGVEGWLGKPQNDFLIQFLYYVFNYSAFVIAITVAIALFGFLTIKKNTVNIKWISLSFVWFILPFLIGFYYSRYVNAVLQYSVLIFSFPLLFFVLFGFMKKQRVKINLILVSIILLANSLSLIYVRRHYDIFYNSVYKEILTDYENIKEESEDILYIIDSHRKISNYYISKLDIDTSYITYFDSFQDINEFKNFLEIKSKTNDKLFLGCLSSVSPSLVPLIQDYFSTIEVQNNYFKGTTYLFSKGAIRTEKIIDFLSFDSVVSEKWSSIDSIRIILENKSTGANSYLLTSDTEWGPMFTTPLKDVIYNENNFIDVSVDAKSSESLEGIILVASLESKSENIYWGGTDFSVFESTDGAPHQWQKFHHSIKLSDIHLKSNNIILKVFIWNKSKRNLLIDNLKISLRAGNPCIYGLFEKI